jgi:uncharacterized protein YecE (DUF72 family)
MLLAPLPELKIGTSGWSYRELEGVFYPMGEKAKLAYYARYFPTVEIDSSFYAYPSTKTIASWLRNSPPGFVFSAKLPKLITHDKALDLTKGVGADFSKFLYLVAPMLRADKLGPVLIQLPPSFTFDKADRLDAFLATLPKKDMQFAVEFRHKSWLREESWELLRRYNVANTVVDEPLLPPEVVVTADFSFVRWHGHGTKPWYNYRYPRKELEPWKEKLEVIRDKTQKTSYGYFNNHYGGKAIENALQMMEITNTASPEQREAQRIITERLDGKLPPMGADADQQSLELFKS